MIIPVPEIHGETVEIVFDDIKSVVGVAKGIEKYNITRIHEFVDLMIQNQEIELDENIKFEIKKQIYNFKVGDRVEIPEFCKIVLKSLFEDLNEEEIESGTMVLKEGASVIKFIKNPEKYNQKEVIYYENEEFIKDLKEEIWISSTNSRRIITYI